ncbi:hypothetical protein ACQKNC_17580 [Lysinibacillus sp. NPDC094177]
MEEKHHLPIKLIDIVQVKLVREKTIPYKEKDVFVHLMMPTKYFKG